MYFHLSCKIVMLCNRFRNTSPWLLATFELRPKPCRVMSVYSSKIQDIPPKKCSDNFIEYFSHTKNGMTKCVGAQKLFSYF